MNGLRLRTNAGYGTSSGHSTRSAFAVRRRRRRRPGSASGHRAEEADAAFQHQLRGRHSRHQRHLGVPALDRERRTELQPVAAVLLGDHLLGDREADAAAADLALLPEEPDLAQEPQLLVGRPAVERLLGAHVVELRAAPHERVPDVDVDALARLVDVHRPDDGGPRLVGQEARRALGEGRRVEASVLVRRVQRLAPLVRLDVHRAAGPDERRHVGDRVPDAVPVAAALDVERLVEVHRRRGVERDEGDGGLVRVRQSRRVRGRLGLDEDLGGELHRDLQLAPQLRERRLDLRAVGREPVRALGHALQPTRAGVARA